MTTTTPEQTSPGQLLDVKGVAVLLACSKRHIYRLADAGRMPRPVRLGSLVRWRKADVLDWISAGCPPTQPTKAPAR